MADFGQSAALRKSRVSGPGRQAWGPRRGPSAPDGVQEPIPGSFNDDHVVRSVVGHALRTCRKSREAVADEMTLLLGARVTGHMLTTFTADSKENHRWPLAWTRAFCQVTGDWSLLMAVAEQAGMTMITPEQARLLREAEYFVRNVSRQEEER